MKQKLWHSISWQQTIKYLKSDFKQGLDDNEAKKRQAKFGLNRLPEKKQFYRIKILLGQLKSPLIYILVIAGVITLILSEYTDSIVIFGAVILNSVVGFFQENKASQALSKLKSAVKHKAKVLRSGNLRVIEARMLVPGDIIVLNRGDQVPADCRLIESFNLKTNEMVLTGEWLGQTKQIKTMAEKLSLADRENMVYTGTIVEDGAGKAIVTAIGKNTEIGKIAEMVKAAPERKTPLQKKIAAFSKIIGGIIAVVSIAIFIEGLITGGDFLEMFTTAIAVAVAAIPEGLPVALTVILALGMERILRRKGLVRKLLAAETLGSTSVICTDKTATLTEGKMRVSRILTAAEILSGSRAAAQLTLEIAMLCNEAFIENPNQATKKWVVQGRPTDKALLLAGIESGVNKKELEKSQPKLHEIPFSSTNKYQASLHKLNKQQNILYMSGAPEKVLGAASFFASNNQAKKLSPVARKKLETELKNLTANGLRVVAVGYRKFSISNFQFSKMKDLIQDFVFVGFIGLNDPLRKDVKEAIKICKRAGMRPILVTGDHKLTAKTIAREIGLKTEPKNIIEGRDLEKLSDKELADKLKHIEVYSRVEPKHKLRIVEAWQAQGEVVAMTGDGVNDAPALKQADVGVAIGSGTDVAREVSDLILLPDSFSIIVRAIEEGRAILDNVRKVITYLLSDSFTEVILIGVALMFGMPLPILPAQILWVNLIEDGLPNIALSFEPKEKDLMKRKPVPANAPLLTGEMKALIFIIGVITDVLLLGLFFWLMKYSGYEMPHIRSIIFAALTIDSIFYVFSCKSLRRNIWHINPLSNKFLIFAWFFGIIMLLAALYIPPLQILLKTVALGVFDWYLVLGLGLSNIILIELTKHWFIARKKFS